MSGLRSFQDLDSHPFTGKLSLNTPIKAKIKEEEHIKHFFDGTEGYEQVKNVTFGKEYEIHAVEGFGDVSDVFFTGDDGTEVELMSDFFVESEDENQECKR